jgi:hypothetical protein
MAPVSNVAPFPLSAEAIEAEHRANARAAREAEAIAERAQLDIADATARGIALGRRVIFRGGEASTWLHATVATLGSDSDGNAQAGVQVFGNGPAVYRMSLAKLRAVCGTCDECRSLSDGTECAR